MLTSSFPSRLLGAIRPTRRDFECVSRGNLPNTSPTVPDCWGFLHPSSFLGVGHIRNSYDRTNRRAVRVGYALFGVSLALLFTGVALMRVEGFEIRNPNTRSAAYWIHVLSPLLAVWLYILHRLAGPRIKWRVGLTWASAVGIVVLGMVFFHSQDPRLWNVAGPKKGPRIFEPSLLARRRVNFIPADTLYDGNTAWNVIPTPTKDGFTVLIISVPSTTSRISSVSVKRGLN